MYNSSPRWLMFLEKKMPWLGIPRLAIILITLQAFGFFLISSSSLWFERLALRPELVLHNGEWWRLITFLAMPLTMNPIWMIFACWFLYSILDQIENEWGDFKTTFYVMVSIVLTVIFSLVFYYPVVSVTEFNSTLFLAAASLFPEQEIRIYMILPVKMKYLAWLSLAFFAYHLAVGENLNRLFLLAIYSNYFIFFGPSLVTQVKNWKRRRDYRSKLR